MKYVVYDPNSGEITVSGECDGPDDHGLGLLLADVEGATSTHYVSGGVLVAYTTDQASAKAQRPDYDAAWSNTTMGWVDLRPLHQAQADRWAAIKAARDAQLYGGFTWDGSRFDSDVIAQGRIAGAFALATNSATAAQAFPKLWKLADNTGRDLSAVDMVAVGLALNDLVQPCIDQGDTLWKQINAATSAAQLEAIQWASQPTS